MNSIKDVEMYIEEHTDEVVKIFKDYDYASAFLGITEDNRAVYHYDKMIEYLVLNEKMTQLEAIEWIDYNTIRALPYFGEKAPIIIY